MPNKCLSLPWKQHDQSSTIILDSQGFAVVGLCVGSSDTICGYICKAVNNHDLLVAALKKIAIPRNGWCEGPCEMCGPEKKRSDIAREALAQMEKEQ